MGSTGNNLADYVRHTYKVSKELKSYTIYTLLCSEGNVNLLTDTIRIEKFQGKSNASNINDYLRLKNTTNWNTSEMVTGLRATKKEVLFYGDWLKPNESNTPQKTLLVFVFFRNRTTLLIDVYRGFYPYNKEILQSILNRYESHL